jgi:hypothetical protein
MLDLYWRGKIADAETPRGASLTVFGTIARGTARTRGTSNVQVTGQQLNNRRSSMGIHLADLMIHIDEHLSSTQREAVETALRGIDGVISVKNPDDRPHLTLVAYRPDQTRAADLLARVKAEGVSAELVGL